jgi:hypothetical protein
VVKMKKVNIEMMVVELKNDHWNVEEKLEE